MNWKDKLTSRKFWLSTASFLGSVGTTIAGLTTENETVAIIGAICATLSAAIYAGCEAYIDAAAVGTGETVSEATEYTSTNSESEGD